MPYELSKRAKCSKFKSISTHIEEGIEIGQCNDWIFQVWFMGDLLILKTDSDLTGILNLISHLISFCWSLIQIWTVYHIRIYFKSYSHLICKILHLRSKYRSQVSCCSFQIWFKSECSYLLSSIWKNRMAAGPALYMSAQNSTYYTYSQGY